MRPCLVPPDVTGHQDPRIGRRLTITASVVATRTIPVPLVERTGRLRVVRRPLGGPCRGRKGQRYRNPRRGMDNSACLSDPLIPPSPSGCRTLHTVADNASIGRAISA
ncbi:hypothetical protein GCM10022245_55900 [Streptomyces mayteni]